MFTFIPAAGIIQTAGNLDGAGKMRFEGPDYSQILAVTGFILSAAFILSIVAVTRGPAPYEGAMPWFARFATTCVTET
jgi:hypothetical protein